MVRPVPDWMSGWVRPAPGGGGCAGAASVRLGARACIRRRRSGAAVPGAAGARAFAVGGCGRRGHRAVRCGHGCALVKVWRWKDELPRRGLAWYGTFLAGRGSFLSPSLLAALYPGAGEVDDHESLPLSPTAHEIVRPLVAGPLPSAVLRRLVGDRNRYQRAVVELHRNLLVTTTGVQESRSGWPSTLIELTCRRFDVGDRHDPVYAAGRYLDTMLQATPAEMAGALRWPVAQARARLDELVSRGWASSDGVRYVAPDRPATQVTGPPLRFAGNGVHRSSERPRSGR